MSSEVRLRNIHPGEVLLEEFMKPLGLTAYRVAKSVGVSQTQVGEIIRVGAARRPGGIVINPLRVGRVHQHDDGRSGGSGRGCAARIYEDRKSTRLNSSH